MNQERNDTRSHHDNLSAVQTHDAIAKIEMGPSSSSNAIVSDTIYHAGIFRFSVTSPKRYD
jgi:hypothetical protein